jgi:FkbM family methyltransferase
VLSTAVANQKRKLDLPIGRGTAARFIAASGALDTPFVLLDVGARDGIHPRWLPLEPAMEVFGFDPIAEIAAPNARHHYFKIALGDHDGESRIHVPDNVYETRVSRDGNRRIPMAKIDTFWRKHSLPPADFIKIDCEGYEPEILQGAEQYLAASDLLGAEIESNFYPTTTLPLSHFATISASLAKHRLLIADLAFIPVQSLAWNGMCEALFARHFINERRDSSSYGFRIAEQNPSLDAILKTIAIFDLYALVAPAAALVREYRALIARRLDADALYQTIMLSQPLMIERYCPISVWVFGRRSNAH